VLVVFLPFTALLLAGCAFQYASRGGLSPGMEWVVGGFAVFALAAMLILPRINYLEFTPQHFTIRELTGWKQIPWADIEPGSVGYAVRTMLFIPMFTTIGFRLKPDSEHFISPLMPMAGAVSGTHATFVNMYTISRDNLMDLIRRHQESYGSGCQQE
jgi:hypothetical protein